MDDAIQSARPWGKIAILTVLVFEVLGAASGWISNSGYGNDWFDQLQKPNFMPPGAAFGIVWPILYACIGVAAAMIHAQPPSVQKRRALILFYIQLALNFLWSPIFFALHDMRTALGVIVVMVALSAGAAGQFFRMRAVAGYLMMPYLAWLVFATTLNSAILSLNAGANQSLWG
jgi:benzodiazapine receptor